VAVEHDGAIDRGEHVGGDALGERELGASRPCHKCFRIHGQEEASSVTDGVR
jgi:hypothetical protein